MCTGPKSGLDGDITKAPSVKEAEPGDGGVDRNSGGNS